MSFSADGKGVALVAIPLILIGFAIAAWHTASRQSPTNDETFHMVSAVAVTRHNDYRVDPVDPPVTKRLVGWATTGIAADLDTQSETWKSLPGDLFAGRPWSSQVLYRSAKVDVDGLFARGRLAMIGVTLLCAAMVAVAAYRLAGPIAAIAATLAFAAHPLVLAHGPLVTADVASALTALALAMSVAWLLERATLPRVALVGLVCGLGLLTKLSAVLFPVMLVLAVAIRALMNRPWSFFKREAATRPQRMGVAIVSVALAGVVAYVVLWAGYGFRYRATVEDGHPIDINRSVASYATNQRALTDPNRGPMTLEEFNAWQPPLQMRFFLWANKHRLLPEAWTNGLIFTQALTVTWPHYYFGQVESRGSWSYFPVAFIVKSPLAWLAALLGGLGLLARLARSRSWSMFAIAAGSVVAVYGVAAMTTSLQEGLRHLMPLFPFAAIAIGIATAVAIPHRPGRWLAGALAGVLLVEVALSGGHYLAYFNAAAGGKTGGAKILGDSNVDWGQGLPSLAAWQRQNPDVRLYLCYTGTADPAHYGIRYINLPGGTPLGPPPQQIREPGVIAISVTSLQGTYASPEFNTAKIYAPLKSLPLLDVLDGSIYLYLWNPQKR